MGAKGLDVGVGRDSDGFFVRRWTGVWPFFSNGLVAPSRRRMGAGLLRGGWKVKGLVDMVLRCASLRPVVR